MSCAKSQLSERSVLSKAIEEMDRKKNTAYRR